MFKYGSQILYCPQVELESFIDDEDEGKDGDADESHGDADESQPAASDDLIQNKKDSATTRPSADNFAESDGNASSYNDYDTDQQEKYESNSQAQNESEQTDDYSTQEIPKPSSMARQTKRASEPVSQYVMDPRYEA